MTGAFDFIEANAWLAIYSTIHINGIGKRKKAGELNMGRIRIGENADRQTAKIIRK
jgi:hypothetical protein